MLLVKKWKTIYNRMTMDALASFILVFGLAIFVLWLGHHIRLPSIVGLLLTGLIAGPYGLKLVHAGHEIELLSEIGIALLMFSIGVEFSLQTFLRIKKTLLIGGGFQVGLTLVFFAFLGWIAAVPLSVAIFIGGIVALSSTAIVIKSLQQQGQVETAHGTIMLAVLIFQDIAIVPMMLFSPILKNGFGIFSSISLMPALLSALIIISVLVSAKYIVPVVLNAMVNTRRREIMLLTILFICFFIGWVTQKAGLSMALGAFLAGLIISESEFGDHAMQHILPFKDLFTSVFFISVGLLLDPGIIVTHPVMVFGGAAAVFVIKFLIGAGVTRLMGFPLRIGVMVGIGLAQIGEFSFILVREGLDLGLISVELYQVVLGVTVITMSVTPFLIERLHAAGKAVERLPLPGFLRHSTPKDQISFGNHAPGLEDHLVIIGFGISGRHLAKTAKHFHIPYLVVELNPQTVKKERALGEPIYYGDATHPDMLEFVGIHKARLLAVPNLRPPRKFYRGY